MGPSSESPSSVPWRPSSNPACADRLTTRSMPSLPIASEFATSPPSERPPPEAAQARRGAAALAQSPVAAEHRPARLPGSSSRAPPAPPPLTLLAFVLQCAPVGAASALRCPKPESRLQASQAPFRTEPAKMMTGALPRAGTRPARPARQPGFASRACASAVSRIGAARRLSSTC